MVVSGMGGLNDAFGDSACSLLDELVAVLQAGVPIVAFGQGIGPITDHALLAKAREVLPRLKLICLREGHTGLPLLQSLGVPSDRIRVTGDDAIELAFQHRRSALGNLIGINLRLASYSGAGDDIPKRLHQPLLRAVHALNSSLVPVPISFSDESSDIRAISRLLGGQIHDSQTTIRSPEDVIDLIGNCRIVVTGSYHAGVFALSQGISVIGLVHSAYYDQKFIGLQQQFPGGCRIIDFRHPTTPDEILEVISSAWRSAEDAREPLLRAANLQIDLGRAAYQSLRNQLTLNPDS
jgi:colanic acid/amylovoran biosynthesis protein